MIIHVKIKLLTNSYYNVVNVFGTHFPTLTALKFIPRNKERGYEVNEFLSALVKVISSSKPNVLSIKILK